MAVTANRKEVMPAAAAVGWSMDDVLHVLPLDRT
jgi:hypothetical protein